VVTEFVATEFSYVDPKSGQMILKASSGLFAGPVQLGNLSTGGGCTECGCSVMTFEITRSLLITQHLPQPISQPKPEPKPKPEPHEEKPHEKKDHTKKPGKKKKHQEPPNDPQIEQQPQHELRPLAAEQWKSLWISGVKGGTKGFCCDPTEFEFYDPDHPTVILGKMEKEKCPPPNEKKSRMKLTMPEGMDVESKALLIYAAHNVVSQFIEFGGLFLCSIV